MYSCQKVLVGVTASVLTLLTAYYFTAILAALVVLTPPYRTDSASHPVTRLCAHAVDEVSVRGRRRRPSVLLPNCGALSLPDMPSELGLPPPPRRCRCPRRAPTPRRSSTRQVVFRRYNTFTAWLAAEIGPAACSTARSATICVASRRVAAAYGVAHLALRTPFYVQNHDARSASTVVTRPWWAAMVVLFSSRTTTMSRSWTT